MAARSTSPQVTRYLARKRRRARSGGDRGLFRTTSWVSGDAPGTVLSSAHTDRPVTFGCRVLLQVGQTIFQVGSSILVTMEPSGINVTVGSDPAIVVAAQPGLVADISVSIRPADGRVRIWVGSRLEAGVDLATALPGGRWADAATDALTVGQLNGRLYMYAGQVPRGFDSEPPVTDPIVSAWTAWGAAPACAYAAPFLEGAGSSSRNYASSIFGEMLVDAWESDALSDYAAASLETPFQTLRPPPLGGMYGNRSSLAARGQSIIVVACTGPMGAGGRAHYLNIEVGAVVPSQRFMTIYVDQLTGGDFYFSVLPGVTSFGAVDPGFEVVAGRRYFVAVHFGYSEDASKWADPDGHECEYHIREFDSAGIQTNAWDGSGLIGQQSDLLSVDGGHVHPLEYWNTNVSRNTNPEPDEYQLLQGMAIFWGGRRRVISDLQAACDFLAPRWAAGDMQVWDPWLTLDPLGDDVGDVTPPSVPGSVSFSDTSSTSASGTWGASTDDDVVQGYRVYRGGQQVGDVAGPSFDDQGLSPETTYDYTVSAYDPSGNESAQSSISQVTTPAVSDTEAPTVPQNLVFVATSETAVFGSWDGSTDNVGVAGYKVYDNSVEVDDVSVIAFSATGLTPNTSHSYTVAAYDAVGNLSAQSAPDVVITDLTAPTAPDDLSVINKGTDFVTIPLGGGTDASGVAGYNLYVGGVLTETSLPGPLFQIEDLTPGTQYSLTATALDPAGNESPPTPALLVTTDIVDITAPTVPPDVVGISTGTSTINFSHNASTDIGGSGLAGYRYYRDGILVADVPV